MDMEQKQNMLSRYFFKLRELERKYKELENWSGVSDSERSRHKRNYKNTGIDHTYGTAMSIEQEIEAISIEVTKLRTELNNALNKIVSLDIRSILSDRYVASMSIKEIANKYKYTDRTIRRKIYEGIEEMESNTNYFNQ